MSVPVNIFLTYQAAVAGQAANVIARIYSADGTAQGTLRATITAGWVEDLDETGASCGYLNTFAADASWGAMLRIKYTISGVPGAGYDTPWMDYGAFFKEYTAFTVPAGLFISGPAVVGNAPKLDFTVDQYSGETFTFPPFVDASGSPVDLSGKAVKFRAETTADLAVKIKYDNLGPNMSISGTGNNVVKLFFAPADLLLNQALKYTLWNATDSIPLCKGELKIDWAVNPSP